MPFQPVTQVSRIFAHFTILNLTSKKCCQKLISEFDKVKKLQKFEVPIKQDLKCSRFHSNKHYYKRQKYRSRRKLKFLSYLIYFTLLPKNHPKKDTYAKWQDLVNYKDGIIRRENLPH